MKRASLHRRLAFASSAGIILASVISGNADAKVETLAVAVHDLLPVGHHVSFAPGVSTKQLVAVSLKQSKQANLRKILADRGLTMVNSGGSTLIVGADAPRSAKVAPTAPVPGEISSPGFSMTLASAPPRPVAPAQSLPIRGNHIVAPHLPPRLLSAPNENERAHHVSREAGTSSGVASDESDTPAAPAPFSPGSGKMTTAQLNEMSAQSIERGTTTVASTPSKVPVAAVVHVVAEAPRPLSQPKSVGRPASAIKAVSLAPPPSVAPVQKGASDKVEVSPGVPHTSHGPLNLSSVMEPVPPPAPVAAPAVTWVATAGGTMASVLHQWAVQAGWSVVYNSDITYPISASATFDGSFLTAVKHFVYSVHADPAPLVHVFSGNHVIVVSSQQKD